MDERVNGRDTNMADMVLKILDNEEWEQAKAQEYFAGSAVDLADGFIHLSTPAQVSATAAKHFRDRNDLMVVAFRASDLGDRLKWEVSRGGDLFPHYYGILPAAHALWAKPVPLDKDGIPVLPGKALTC